MFRGRLPRMVTAATAHIPAIRRPSSTFVRRSRALQRPAAEQHHPAGEARRVLGDRDGTPDEGQPHRRSAPATERDGDVGHDHRYREAQAAACDPPEIDTASAILIAIRNRALRIAAHVTATSGKSKKPSGP